MKGSSAAIGGKPTLFRHIIHDSDLPESELTVDRLTKEAQILLGAGSVSTARTLHFVTFYLLSNEHMRVRLEDELKEAAKTRPDDWNSWAALEKLPYLQALIKEASFLSAVSVAFANYLIGSPAQSWYHASFTKSVSGRSTPVYRCAHRSGVDHSSWSK